MSVVVCLKNGDEIEFTSDSIIVAGYTKELAQEHYAKLFKIDGLIVGSVGSAEESSLMRLFCRNHTPVTSTESGILDFIVEFGAWKKGWTDDGDIVNSYLIGFNGRAFAAEHLFVYEIKDFAAIGAGRDFALAALHLGLSAYDAVDVACALSVWCALPVVQLTMEAK